MDSDEYVDHDATGLAELIRGGEVKRSEVLECAIDIAERRNPELNALASTAFDAARERARAKDDAPPSGAPFDGVPFLLKDLGVDLRGLPHTFGSRAMRDNVSAYTDTLGRRYVDSGVTIMGRTTTPEFGLIAVTESELYGDTRNPWDLGHTPGASSGGSGAAVAAGIVPFAHANDGGGSIRIPASCCGLVGMKPSRNRTPCGPNAGETGGGFVYQHVVARTVRDCAGMLDATAGPEIGDIYFPPPQARPYVEEVGTDPGPLRIAYWTRYWDKDLATDPECVAAVEGAAKALAGLGHRVEETRPQLDFGPLVRAFGLQWGAMAAGILDNIGALVPDLDESAVYEPFTRELAAIGRSATASELTRAREALFAAARITGRFHEEHDVLVTTVLGTPPLRIGEWSRASARFLEDDSRANRFMLCTHLFNATGQPSMTLPLHWTADGLPVGVMFTAANGREDLLYRLAGQLEQAVPWKDRRPPCFG
jgi:amidase